MKSKLLAALGLGAVVLGASQAAMAGGVSFGVNIGVPVAPVYVAPAPVYAPPPVVAYAPPPPVVPVAYVAPAIVIGWHGDRYWDGRRWYGRRDWYGRRHW
ncbi:hypothetical protein AAHK20_01525 [Trinickia sp. YCB016]